MLKNTPPIHPILIALFPVLSLYSANWNQLSLGDALPTFLLVLLFSLVLWAILFILTRDLKLSAIASSLVSFLFFSFVHSLTAVSFIAELLYFLFSHNLTNVSVIAELTESYESVRPLVETREGMLIWLFFQTLLAAFMVILFASRIKQRISLLSKSLNFFSILLVCVILLTLAFNLFTQNQALAGSTLNQIPIEENEFQSVSLDKENLPDIYYLVLDGYGRSDILEEIYQLDNGEFIAFLESKGFYVAEESSSNYSQTGLSLASSLNLAYLDKLSLQVGSQSQNLSPLKAVIEDSLVFSQLRKAGYKIVSFSSGFTLTELNTVDHYLSPQGTPDSFQNILINNTPLAAYLLEEQYDWHRERIQFAYQQLPGISQESQPQFVFAHILAPHPPFVFGPNGERLTPPRKYAIHDGSHFMAVASREEYVDGYRHQLTYITQATMIAIERILENSAKPPVIIIQGDHGPGSLLDHRNLDRTNLRERMSILNAYLIPEMDPDPLYPQISPVNSFRVLFNHYLGTGYPLLEDRSYFSTIEHPFQFTDVTEKLND